MDGFDGIRWIAVRVFYGIGRHTIIVVRLWMADVKDVGYLYPFCSDFHRVRVGFAATPPTHGLRHKVRRSAMDGGHRHKAAQAR